MAKKEDLLGKRFGRLVVTKRAPKDREYTLAMLRAGSGFTQAQLAKRAGITQSEISRAELRSDCRVSTLKRYAKALGGNLLLCVEINGRKCPIALKEHVVRVQRHVKS